MDRRNNLLPLALIVSAVLFLMACPHKAGGGASDGNADGPDVPQQPVIHGMGNEDRIPRPRHAKISLPRLHLPRASGRGVVTFREDERHPAGMRRAAAP